jgi:hypothetical protein
MDVLTGVTSEFLLNVGRTLRFLCDKYAKTMTPEVRMSRSAKNCQQGAGLGLGVWHRDEQEEGMLTLSMMWLGNHSTYPLRIWDHEDSRP